VDRLSKYTGENKIEDEILIEVLRRAISLTYSLREKKDQTFEKDKLENLTVTMSELFETPMFQNDILDFVDQFSQRFGREDADLFVSSLLLVLIKPGSALEIDHRIINKILDLNNFVSAENRNKVLTRVDVLVSSSDQDKTDLAIGFIERIISLAEYHEQLKILSQNWLEKLASEAINVFKSKNKLFDLLINNNFLSADAYVGQVIKLLPFGGDQEQLKIVLGSIDRLRKQLSVDAGKMLSSALLAHLGPIDAQGPKALGLASNWVGSLVEAERISFDAAVLRHYTIAPNEHLPILSVSWQGLTIDQIQDYIIQIYRKEMDEKFTAQRDLALLKALKVINVEERQKAIASIWENLINDRNAAESFMGNAKGLLTLEEINSMRQRSIELIKENTNSEKFEINLRFLAATIRDDTRIIMPVVDLFVDLFGRSPDDVRLALKYVVECLNPFGLRDDHKDKLAKAMRKIPVDNDEDIAFIKEKAKQLDLKWFKHEKEKNWWQ
jgi:hypothetical protein